MPLPFRKLQSPLEGLSFAEKDNPSKTPLKTFTFLFLLISSILVSSYPSSNYPFSLTSPALAYTDPLPVSAPSGQSVLYAQTEKDASGACYRGQGRSFLLNWSPTLTDLSGQSLGFVSGLGLYVVTRPDRYGPLDKDHFQLELRKGMEPSLSDRSQVIFTDLSPSGSNLVEEYNENGRIISQTSIVYFTFPSPLALGKSLPGISYRDTFYTAYLTCNVPQLRPDRYLLRETGSYRLGMSSVYDEINQASGYSHSTALNLVLYSPSSSPRPGSNEAMKPSSPSFRPLILIHGLGGKPEDWIQGRTNYQTYLKGLGYPDNYVHYYSYGSDDKGNYNYQGDIRQISLGLETIVNTLSDKHKADGGDGKVDLMGYSLGGVIGRQYLSTHLRSHKVHKLITIGSPHQGAWLLATDATIKDLPFYGLKIEKNITDKLVEAINYGKNQKLDLNSTAVKQIYPGSEFLDGYYGINRRVPQDIEYATFYGDIHASIRRKLFGSIIDKKISVGDGLILPESASGIPGVSPEKHSYSEDAVFNLKLNKTETGYAFNLELPAPDLMKAFHTYLLDRTDLRKDLACSVLGLKDASLCK